MDEFWVVGVLLNEIRRFGGEEVWEVGLGSYGCFEMFVRYLS